MLDFECFPAVAAPTGSGQVRGRDTVRVNEVSKLEA
jgi:hypothetical protein